MDIKDVQKSVKDEKRSKSINIRTFPSYSKWMSKNNVSPSAVFNQAIEELMKKENK